jgi:hypothetical protein
MEWQPILYVFGTAIAEFKTNYRFTANGSIESSAQQSPLVITAFVGKQPILLGRVYRLVTKNHHTPNFG